MREIFKGTSPTFKLGFLIYLLGATLLFSVVSYLYFFTDYTFPTIFLFLSIAFLLLGYIYYRWFKNENDYSAKKEEIQKRKSYIIYYFLVGIITLLVYLTFLIFLGIEIISSLILIISIIALFLGLKELLIFKESTKKMPLIASEEWMLILLILLVFISTIIFLGFFIFQNF